LNLNDIAENNLKNASVGFVMPQIGSRSDFVTRIIQQSLFLSKEDVDNFALAEPYIVLRLLLSVLCKRIRCDYCSFLRKKAGIYHNSVHNRYRWFRSGLYRKMHIPDDPHFYEKFYFTPGDLGFKNIPTKRKNRNLNLLGSMVPRSGSFDCFKVLKSCFTQQQLMASTRKRAIWRKPHMLG
jgi:N-carbamoylputrescine amidase